MEFKDLIRKRRNELGLTMEELGKRIGVSKATIQRYESGEIKNVRRDKITKLAEALEVTPAYLMGWKEQNDVPNHHEITSTILSDNRLMELILMFNNLTKENKNKIYDYCKYVHDMQSKESE